MVTITGTGFSITAGATIVAFGSTEAKNVSCSSSTQCTATSPLGSGTVSVRVTVAGQTSVDTAADDFTYVPPPTVTVAVSPPDGANGWYRTSPVLAPVTATASPPSTIATLTCTAGTLGPVSGLGSSTAAAQLSVGAQGATTGTCSATSPTSDPGTSAPFTITLDSVAPTLTASLTTADGQPYTPGSQAVQPVTVTFACTDAASGVAVPHRR